MIIPIFLFLWSNSYLFFDGNIVEGIVPGLSWEVSYICSGTFSILSSKTIYFTIIACNHFFYFSFKLLDYSIGFCSFESKLLKLVELNISLNDCIYGTGIFDEFMGCLYDILHNSKLLGLIKYIFWLNWSKSNKSSDWDNYGQNNCRDVFADDIYSPKSVIIYEAASLFIKVILGFYSDIYPSFYWDSLLNS